MSGLPETVADGDRCRLEVDALLEQFRTAWQNGQTPHLEDYLPTGPCRHAALRELISFDLSAHLLAGRDVQVEDYLDRFSELAGDRLLVLALLRVEFESRRRLGQVALGASFRRRFPQYEEEIADWPEDRAGRYVLVAEIGEGGQGAVWRAHDPNCERPLAVKILRLPCLGNANAERRFLTEARLTARLQHPGIPPVHEIGHLDDGRPFFAMKLIEGRTLAELLRERSLVPDAADLPRWLTLFAQVCQTVAYAHAQRIIHRDLKPSNVMVGAFGEVQVMDWGLAKVLTSRTPQQPADDPASAGATDTDPLAVSTVAEIAMPGEAAGGTRQGHVLGTWAYMPPEQARGEIDQLDERCDVFGLGAILCQILTGKPPYATPGEIRRQAEAGDLSDAFARLAVCGADPELIDLARQCLAAPREKRFRDAGVVAARLADYQASVQERLRRAELERTAAEARAAADRDKARAERRSRRLTAGLAVAGIVLVLGASVAGLWYQRYQQDEAERRAQQNRLEQTAGQALDECEAQQRAGHWTEAAAVLERAAGQIRDTSPEELRRRARQVQDNLALVTRFEQIRLDMATIKGGRFDTRGAATAFAREFAQAHLSIEPEDAEEMAQQIQRSPIKQAIVAALDEWAFAEGGTRGWRRLAAVARRARVLALARRLDPDPWRDRFRNPAIWQDPEGLRRLAQEVDPQTLLAGNLANFGQVLEAAGVESVSVLRRAQELNPSDFWVNYYLGNALSRRGRAGQNRAIAYYRAALAVRPTASAVYVNLSAVLLTLRDRAGALQTAARGVALSQDSALAHSNLSGAFFENKDLAGAWREAVTAIQIDPESALAHVNLGNVLATWGMLEMAELVYRRAVLLDDHLPEALLALGTNLLDRGDHAAAIQRLQELTRRAPTFAMAHNNLGVALRARGDVDGALAAYQKAIELDPELALAHSNLGQALYLKNDLVGSIKALERAIFLDPEFALAHYNLGETYHQRKEYVRAIACYRRAIACDPNLAVAHTNLGVALSDNHERAAAIQVLRETVRRFPTERFAYLNLGQALGDEGAYDQAVAVLEELVAREPHFVNGHGALGLMLRQLGRFEESVASYRRARTLLAADDPKQQVVTRQLERSEFLLSVDRRLATVLRGEAQPASTTETLDLAFFCLVYKRRFAVSARFSAEAFRAQPELADDFRQWRRFNAACAAAQAGCGLGHDAPLGFGGSRARLRRQALDWLKADLVPWRKMTTSDKPEERTSAVEVLRYWRTTRELVCVRDPEALKRLPETERAAWRRFWDEVDETLRRAEKP